jgi:hypothetical protein
MLLDGRLLGHWRVRSSSQGHVVETRTRIGLDERQRTAVARSIERYQRFLVVT